MNGRMVRSTGFTLIELMIAVAIIGILAMLAYPSYARHLVKGNRSAAQGYLMGLAQRQQQYLLDNRGYADQATMLGLDPVPMNVSNVYTVTIANSNYKYAANL